MPFEITNEGDYLLARIFGVVTPADLDRFAEEGAIAEEATPTSMDRITDMTAVERFDVGYPAISNLASRRRVRRFSKPIKSAIVAGDAIQFGFARMFQTLNDHPQVEFRLFGSIAEAKAWLSLKAIS